MMRPSPAKPLIVDKQLDPFVVAGDGSDVGEAWKPLERFGIQPHSTGVQVYAWALNSAQIRALGETLISVADNLKKRRSLK